MKENWVLIGKMRSGWHASAKSRRMSANSTCKSASSSYDTGDTQLSKYAEEAEEGAWVYDASAASPSQIVDFVYSGPIVDVDLAPGEVKSFAGLRKTALDMCGPGGLTGAFRDYVKAAQDEKFTGLDQVAVDVYLALLSRIPLVRIGRVKAGKVEWL